MLGNKKEKKTKRLIVGIKGLCIIMVTFLLYQFFHLWSKNGQIMQRILDAEKRSADEDYKYELTLHEMNSKLDYLSNELELCSVNISQIEERYTKIIDKNMEDQQVLENEIESENDINRVLYAQMMSLNEQLVRCMQNQLLLPTTRSNSIDNDNLIF